MESLTLHDCQPDELLRVLQEAGIGGTVTYTSGGDGQTLQFTMPTMEFTANLLRGYCPPYLLHTVLCFALGFFVFWRDPGIRFSHYLLKYLALGEAMTGPIHEY